MMTQAMIFLGGVTVQALPLAVSGGAVPWPVTQARDSAPGRQDGLSFSTQPGRHSTVTVTLLKCQV